jgi:hypothetical protein
MADEQQERTKPAHKIVLTVPRGDAEQVEVEVAVGLVGSAVRTKPAHRIALPDPPGDAEQVEVEVAVGLVGSGDLT